MYILSVSSNSSVTFWLGPHQITLIHSLTHSRSLDLKGRRGDMRDAVEDNLTRLQIVHVFSHLLFSPFLHSYLLLCRSSPLATFLSLFFCLVMSCYVLCNNWSSLALIFTSLVSKFFCTFLQSSHFLYSRLGLCCQIILFQLDRLPVSKATWGHGEEGWSAYNGIQRLLRNLCCVFFLSSVTRGTSAWPLFFEVIFCENFMVKTETVSVCVCVCSRGPSKTCWYWSAELRRFLSGIFVV